MGYSDSEIIIRKCTDSDFPEISSFHYPEAKRTLTSSFELDKAINFLLTRIFTEPGSNPVRVFKSLDLATYLLINGNREIEQKLKSYRSSFKGLKSVIFEPSIYSEKMSSKIDHIVNLLCDRAELKKIREQVAILDVGHTFTPIQNPYQTQNREFELPKMYDNNVQSPSAEPPQHFRFVNPEFNNNIADNDNGKFEDKKEDEDAANLPVNVKGSLFDLVNDGLQEAKIMDISAQNVPEQDNGMKNELDDDLIIF